MSLLTSLFGDANKRFLSSLTQQIAAVNGFESELATLSDDALKERTASFRTELRQAFDELAPTIVALREQIRLTVGDTDRQRLKRELIRLSNEPLDSVLPRAFATVREAARRTLNQRHFDVQLMGGMVLHSGQVAEMKTGEGKTLTSTLAIYLNALTGRGVHVVTVNDYLARRDATWMGQIFHALGLTVGVIAHEVSYLYDPSVATATQDSERDQGIKVEQEFLKPTDRKSAYRADITYGTNNEFGFDYLRDNMVQSLQQKVQRELHYAIIDEVDSILIDEARTPLIISAQDTRSTDRYYQFAKIVETLEPHTDYTVDEKQRAATLTENGIAKVEKLLNVENLYIEQGIQTVHHIEQALKAKALFKRDKDYTIKDGEVLIVDEFTGRLLPGRRYSEGLHQAIEAKENVKIQQESRTMATITFQNYFRLYHKLAGMTGTAETEAEELAKIYNLEVTSIPTNKPMIRQDQRDRIYKTEKGKFRAIVEEIKKRHEKGQPVLVGTISIEKNEYLSDLLAQEGLPFNMLNAKQHEREAEIIAQAGSAGAITIATNMAGRGVDIKLGGSPYNAAEFKKITSFGGLHVLGTERHESRRIDNQLRGRSGRQGEPGSSQFYVSLEDDLMRIFGAERVKGLMKSWPEDLPIENGFISKSLETAQKRVEGHNFDIRKHLVEYDDVINKQRAYIYVRRDQWLATAENGEDELRMLVRTELEREIDALLAYQPLETTTADAAIAETAALMRSLLGLSEAEAKRIEQILHDDIADPTPKLYEIAHIRLDQVFDHIKQRLQTDDTQVLTQGVVSLYLRSMDMLWVDHLETINYLRTGIGLRGYGQRDPLVEYKRESKDLFTRLLDDMRRGFVQALMNLGLVHQHTQAADAPQLIEQKNLIHAFGQEEEANESIVSSKPKDETGHKIGRNDPCYCGSGKKYKKCHGK